MWRCIKYPREFFRNGKVSGNICAGGSFGILETLGKRQTSLPVPERPRSSKVIGIR